MTTMYDPDKIAKLASTGDAFWRGAQWILDQQAASRLDPPHRAAFMSDRISMDEAREKVRAGKFGAFAKSADNLTEHERHIRELMEQIENDIAKAYGTMACEDYDQEWTRMPATGE